jgi:hypothetical protein
VPTTFGPIDLTKLPKDLLIFENEGFSCIKPSMLHGAYAQDGDFIEDPIEADVMAIVQNIVA